MSRRLPRLWVWTLGGVLTVVTLGVLTVRNTAHVIDSSVGERPEARKAVMQEILAATLPFRLAGQERRQLLSGAAALAEIGRLHGDILELTGGRVARYGDAPGITVWAGQALSAGAADRMVDAMTEVIASGGTPFHLASKAEAGLTRASGLGRAHVFYASGTQVVWIAAPEGVMDVVVSEISAALPR